MSVRKIRWLGLAFEVVNHAVSQISADFSGLF